MRERLDLDLGRNERERAFLLALQVRAERDDWWGDVWDAPDCLMVSVSICDERSNSIVHTLRVDFFGDRVIAGEDEAGLDPLSWTSSERWIRCPIWNRSMESG